jgi:ATP-binding cassette, subfamily C (CFTR/MRP), member 1
VRERINSSSHKRIISSGKKKTEEEGEEDNKDGDVLLDIQSASFQVGGDHLNMIQQEASNTSNNQYGFTLENISFSVGVNQVIAVVGGVATGKSLLLDGLLGNAKQVKGNKPKLSKLALYCSQQPFVLNATVKNNILFGLKYDEDKYNRAIYASCLHSDLLLLPAGDETEIGERGVTLSGGQKARVGLARCVYAYEAGDVCCLDDPLGALDASTAIT